MTSPTIKFYCITLSSRNDRQDQINKQFERLHIDDVIWWTVDRHPKGGKYGCFESHVNIWEQNDADIAVIFEDDVEFTGTPQQFQHYLEEAILLANRYDTVHLGHIAVSIQQRISLNFYQGKFITTSCYLGRKDALRKLGHQVKRFYGSHIDTVLFNLSDQIGLLPYCFRQNFNNSNNSWSDSIPILAGLNLDPILRNMLTSDPYCLLKYPRLLPETAIRLMFGLTTLQNLLPCLLYTHGTEYTDRRVQTSTLTR